MTALHRHKNLKGAWVTGVADGYHTHSDLEARIAALEAPIVVVPPVAPSARYFPLPVTTQTVNVPATIDATGATDVSVAMQTFIDGCPNGTLVSFPAGATYLLAGDGIRIPDGRTNLILEGHGATLRTTGPRILDSAFIFGWAAGGASHITIRNFALRGDNPNPGTSTQFHPGQESSQGVSVYRRASYIELDRLTIADFWGHALYVSTGGHPGEEPDHIWVHDCTVDRMGVMGVAIAAVKSMWVEDNTINDTAIYPIDFEDGQAGEAMQHVYIRRNKLNRWCLAPQYTGHAIVGDGSTGMVWDDVVIDGNVLTGGDVLGPSGGGEFGDISFWGNDTKNGLQIINNDLAALPAAVPAIRVHNAPGVVITGNNYPPGGGRVDVT